MKFKESVLKLINISKDPRKEWNSIAQENKNPTDIYINFIIPLILISCLFKLAGRLISLDFSILNAFLTCIAFIVITSGIIYLSSLIINELLPKFKSDKNFNIIFSLIAYSSGPAIIINGISSLHPDMSFINILSLYSVVIFWIGTIKLLSVPKEQTVGFALVSLILISAIIFIINLIIMPIVVSLAFLNF